MNIGDGLKAVLDFEAEANKLPELKGNMYFEGKTLNLHELVSAYLPVDMGIAAGSADIKIWGQMAQAALVSAKFDMQLRQAVFTKKAKGNFTIANLDSQLNWQAKDKQWQVDVNRFLLETSDANQKANKKWPNAIVSVAGENATDKGLQKLKLSAQHLDLAETSKLLGFFAPLDEAQAKLVNQSQLKGLLRDFSLYAEPEALSFALAGSFDALSVEPVLSAPGIENLSGRVKGSDTLGAIEVDAQDANLKAPQLFDKPILLDKLKGLVNWQQSDELWAIASQSLSLDCAAFKTESRMLLKLPKTEGSPFLDLQTALTSEDMGKIKAYLPTKALKPIIKDWLEPAFIAGKITKGDVLFYGNTRDLPFSDGTGVLEAKLEVNKMELNFNPEWPHLLINNGLLSYEHNDIIGTLSSGKMGNVAINKAEALIPRLGSNDERLFIKGEAQGDIGEVLAVLQQSPLSNRVSPVTKATSTQGPAKLEIDLTIPLWDGQELKANGNANLKQRPTDRQAT